MIKKTLTKKINISNHVTLNLKKTSISNNNY